MVKVAVLSGKYLLCGSVMFAEGGMCLLGVNLVARGCL